MQINKIKLSEHFLLHEFECSCCRTVRLHHLLLERLQALRDIWQRPLIVTSGYRCEAHNAKVSGAVRSKHRIGCAADVFVPADRQGTFRTLALNCGFTKATAYPDRHFVHLEV